MELPAGPCLTEGMDPGSRVRKGECADGDIKYWEWEGAGLESGAAGGEVSPRTGALTQGQQEERQAPGLGQWHLQCVLWLFPWSLLSSK